MRNQIPRILCFALLLNVLIGGGLWIEPAPAAAEDGELSVVDTTYDPVTILNKDFTQALENQTALQLGFDYNTITSGTKSAVIEIDPVSNQKALHLSASDVTTASGGNNEFQISKTFSEALTGTITTEITFMQTGTAKQRDRILQFFPSVGTSYMIGTGVDSSNGGIVYFQATAPSSSWATYNLNQWHTLRVDINTVTQRYSMYLDGTLIYARQKLNTVTKYDLKKLVIATPSGTGDLWVRGVKVTRTPFNPKPKAPTLIRVTGRNGKIAWMSEHYSYASRYRIRIKEKGQTEWLNITSSVNYKDYTTVGAGGALTPNSDISSYYDTTLKKSVGLTNGKTYILGLSVVTRDEAGVYNSGVAKDFESEITEFEGTPSATTPIQTPSTSIFDTITAYANYNASQWSLNSGLNIGDLVFADKAIKFTEIPDKYGGMEWLRTTQADTMKYPQAADGTVQAQIIGFQVRDKASVYVAMDANETPPTWLSDWTDTGDVIKMGDTTTNYSFKIYEKEFASGEQVMLGYNDYTNYVAGKNAGYFVMAQRVPLSLTLDPVKEWVNTASYSVTGSVYEDVDASGVTLSVYQNQHYIPVGKLANKNFKVDLTLLPGANYIEVYAMRSNSALSDKVTATINYDTVVPEIRIATPPTTVKENVYTLQGSLSKAANLTIKLNGVKIADSVAMAVYEPFSYSLTLAEGANSIEVSSIDQAGNVKAVSYQINYVFWAGQAATYDFSGNPLNNVTASTDILAQRQVTNTTATTKRITLWFVLYNGSNTMIDYASVIADFEPGEMRTLSAGFALPEKVTGYYVKAFIWDSLDGMNPLSDEFIVQ